MQIERNHKREKKSETNRLNQGVSISNRRGNSPRQNEASHIWSFSFTYKMLLLESTKWWRYIALLSATPEIIFMKLSGLKI